MTAHDPNAFDPLILDALHIPAHRLLTICRQLAPAHRRRVTIPVLETCLIEAGPSGTTFRQTDLDLQVVITADDLTCAKPFRTCVSLALLRRFASSFDGVIRMTYLAADAAPGGPAQMPRLTLATDDGCSATVNALIPADDFPVWPTELAKGANDWKAMTCTPAELRRLFDLSRPCISTDETRYYLNGVNLSPHPDRGTLRAVATDGHRMAIIDSAIPAIEALNTILPTCLVKAIATLISPKTNDTVTLAFHQASPRVRVTCGSIRIDCKLIDGSFPDYTRVIPKNPARMTMTLSANALRRLLPFATQRANVVEFTNGRAILRDIDSRSEVSAPVTMTAAEGEALDMMKEVPNRKAEHWGFNPTYLQVQARLTPTFRMECGAPGDPARVYGEDTEAMWVIMPRRVLA